MPLAPEIASFGDGDHTAGDSGLSISGGGFGAFPGTAWIYENSNRTGQADQLTVASWNDLEIQVSIPSSLNNSTGTRYLFVQREDLAWSQGFEFTFTAGVGVVDESESVLSVTAAKAYTIGIIDEAEEILGVAASKGFTIGIVDESESVGPVFSGVRVMPGGATFGVGLPEATFEI